MAQPMASAHLPGNSIPPVTSPEVVEVFMHNFLQELERVSELVEKYNFIAMVSAISSLIFAGHRVSRRCVRVQLKGKESYVSFTKV